MKINSYIYISNCFSIKNLVYKFLISFSSYYSFNLKRFYLILLIISYDVYKIGVFNY